jgi:hypothetical protein
MKLETMVQCEPRRGYPPKRTHPRVNINALGGATPLSASLRVFAGLFS